MKQPIRGLCRVAILLAVGTCQAAVQADVNRIVLSSGAILRLHEGAESPLKVMRITETRADDGTLTHLALVVRNISDKPILAAKLYVHMPDDSGVESGEFVIRYFLGRTNAWVTARAEPGEQWLQPNEERTVAALPIEDGLERYVRNHPSWPPDYRMTVTVQRVVYGDGTGWLPYADGTKWLEYGKASAP